MLDRTSLWGVQYSLHLVIGRVGPKRAHYPSHAFLEIVRETEDMPTMRHHSGQLPNVGSSQMCQRKGPTRKHHQMDRKYVPTPHPQHPTKSFSNPQTEYSVHARLSLPHLVWQKPHFTLSPPAPHIRPPTCECLSSHDRLAFETNILRDHYPVMRPEPRLVKESQASSPSQVMQRKATNAHNWLPQPGLCGTRWALIGSPSTMMTQQQQFQRASAHPQLARSKNFR